MKILKWFVVDTRNESIYAYCADQWDANCIASDLNKKLGAANQPVYEAECDLIDFDIILNYGMGNGKRTKKK